MTTLARWTLHDTDTGATWVFPINPYQMTSPNPPKKFTLFSRAHAFTGTAMVAGVSRAIQLRADPYEWQFVGNIRTAEHLATLKTWAAKTNRVQISDHLGRSWRIRITGLEVEEQKPSRLKPYRYGYTAKAVIYDRLT